MLSDQEYGVAEDRRKEVAYNRLYKRRCILSGTQQRQKI